MEPGPHGLAPMAFGFPAYHFSNLNGKASSMKTTKPITANPARRISIPYLVDPMGVEPTTDSLRTILAPSEHAGPSILYSSMKFLTACYARSGSSLLADGLKSHPQICYGGEMFNQQKVNKRTAEMQGATATDYLKLHWVKAKESVTAFGFKLTYHQSRNPFFQPIWDQILKERFKIIMLTRRNLFNRYLSHQLVRAHPVGDNKFAFSGVKYFRQVAINPLDCIKDIEKRKKHEDFFRQSFRNHDVLEVQYEELLDSYPQILDFLEVRQEPPVWTHTKQRVLPHCQLVSNYRQLKKALRNTAYSQYLDEDEFRLL